MKDKFINSSGNNFHSTFISFTKMNLTFFFTPNLSPHREAKYLKTLMAWLLLLHPQMTRMLKSNGYISIQQQILYIDRYILLLQQISLRAQKDVLGMS